jgi:hypothetical protein
MKALLSTASFNFFWIFQENKGFFTQGQGFVRKDREMEEI